MECLNCKEVFESDNKRKVFCSGKCKVAYHRKNVKKEQITKLDLKILYNEILALLQNTSANQIPQQKVYDAPIKEEPKRKYPTHEVKSFQQFMNEISELEFEEEYRDKAMEIREADHLSKKQQELLFLNMRQPKN